MNEVPREGLGITVPATTANLGPGFDAMGLALDITDELWLLPSDELRIEVSGEGAETVPGDERHLVVATIRAGLRAFGHPEPELPFLLRVTNAIPHSRGLGSSAAAIVAGYGLAWLLRHPDRPIDKDRVLELAAQDEGHPDNVAAAIHGGAVLAWPRSDREATGLVHLQLDPSIRTLAYVPAGELRTAMARTVLPDALRREEVVAQAGRAALLVHALANAPEELLEATRDWLHQQQRGALMPESLGLMERLRGAGVPAVISGAGPTVLALGNPEQLARAGAVDHWGFRVLELAPGEGMMPITE